jgi:integrase
VAGSDQSDWKPKRRGAPDSAQPKGSKATPSETADPPANDRQGLRKGELLGQRWEDLDLAGGTASIRRTLQRTNSGGLTALPTKTQNSERRIALPTPCLRSVEQHRDHQREEREAAGTDWKNSGYVFTRPDGSPIEGATLTGTSTPCSAEPPSAASASTTSGTRQPHSSWNRAWSSS